MGREKVLDVVNRGYVHMTREDIERELGASLDEIASLEQYGLRAPELEALFRTADELSPKVLVEIGACHGLSSVVLGAVARKYKGRLYSVEYKQQADWVPNLQRYGVEEYVTMVEGLAPWLDWVNMPFKRVTYLLVDGNHYFFPVACDFQTFAPFVHKGGRIAFHDYNKPAGKSGVKEVVCMAEKLYPLKRVAFVEGRHIPGLVVLEKLTNKPVRR